MKYLFSYKIFEMEEEEWDERLSVEPKPIEPNWFMTEMELLSLNEKEWDYLINH